MISTASHAPSFSIADLEAFDGAAHASTRERRFLCPLCGEGKPQDMAHRSFCANVQTGAWNCKRCKVTGKLTDFWRDDTEPRPKFKPLDVARRRRAPLSALPDANLEIVPESEASNWREQLGGACLVQDEDAAAYLLSRGISLNVATLSALILAPSFYGRPAIMFPLRDFDNHLTGASGRYFHANATPKTRIAGNKRDAIFTAPVVATSGRVFLPFAANVLGVVITEAPIDALSLATSGFPAIALCGTSAPRWITRACGLKRVLLACDADEAGDTALETLTALLSRYGARCERLRPEGGKDWNEVLQNEGREYLADWLAVRVL